jgi:hypothetical protein
MNPSRVLFSRGGVGRARLVWALVATMLVAHATLAWVGRMPGVLTGEDEAIYLLLSRELAQFRYTDAYLTHQPVHAMYPPGYPAALALWSAVVGAGFDRSLLLGIGASAGALLLTFLTIRRIWSETIALVVLAPLAVNPYLIDRAGTLASEAPYLLLTMLALWGAARGDRRGLVTAGAAALAAALTRSIGVTILGALAVNWLWGRKFGVTAAVAAVAALTAGVWLAWSFSAPGKFIGTSYAADFTQAGLGGGPAALGLLAAVGSRIAINVPTYLAITIPGLLPLPALPGTLLDNGLGAALTVVGLLTGGVVLWRRWRAAALYLGATAAVLAVWPWHVERFAMPLLPLLVGGVVIGLGGLVGRRRPRWELPAMAGVAGLLYLTGAGLTASQLSAKVHCERGQSPPSPSCVGRDQASFFAALDYVRTDVPADAILLTSKRATAYYYTGRRQIQWQTAAAVRPDSLITFLRQERVGYVLLGSLHWADLDQLPKALTPNCATLALVRAFPPRTYLFRLRGPGEPDDGSGCAALAEHRERNIARDFNRDP